MRIDCGRAGIVCERKLVEKKANSLIVEPPQSVV
jgi:hypothetical protein